MRLEYRLLGDTKDYPLLYYFDNLEKDEIALRFACDYFVKDNLVYEKTSNAMEGDLSIVYLKPALDEHVVDCGILSLHRRDGIPLEVREFKEGTDQYPVIYTYNFRSRLDALLYLQSNLIFLHGQEWEKTSSEIDEDRKVFVFYAKPLA